MVDRMANMPTTLLRIQQMLANTKDNFHRGIGPDKAGNHDTTKTLNSETQNKQHCFKATRQTRLKGLSINVEGEPKLSGLNLFLFRFY